MRGGVSVQLRGSVLLSAEWRIRISAASGMGSGSGATVILLVLRHHLLTCRKLEDGSSYPPVSLTLLTLYSCNRWLFHSTVTLYTTTAASARVAQSLTLLTPSLTLLTLHLHTYGLIWACACLLPY